MDIETVASDPFLSTNSLQKQLNYNTNFDKNQSSHTIL